jgi:hypothetical protein
MLEVDVEARTAGLVEGGVGELVADPTDGRLDRELVVEPTDELLGKLEAVKRQLLHALDVEEKKIGIE